MEKNQIFLPQKESCVCIFETCKERNVGGGLLDFCFETEAQAVFGQKGNRWGPTSHHKPLCICALAVFSQHWDTQCYLHKSQFWKNTCVYVSPLSNKKTGLLHSIETKIQVYNLAELLYLTGECQWEMWHYLATDY